MSTPRIAYDETAESIAQWVGVYRSFFVNPRRGGEVVETPGLFIACAGTLLPLGNDAVFTTGPEDVADLERRITTGHGMFSRRGLQGLFCVCDALVPTDLRNAMPAMFARCGYVPTEGMVGMTGMAAEGILPPIRPLPELRYRRVEDSHSAELMAWLNILAYGMPLEWGPDWEARTGMAETGAFGFIGYRDEQPITCALTIPLDGRLYVGMVATHPDHRGRGYAEAVMRRSLEVAAQETGLNRTILHATDMGHRVYLRMGYHDTVHFTLYAHAA